MYNKSINSNERVIMENKIDERFAIGKELASTTAKGFEMERLYAALNLQFDVIKELDSRLGPVLHRLPEDEANNMPASTHHISDAIDILSNNTRKLQKMLDQVAL